MITDLSKLKGNVIGIGAKDIKDDDIITLVCYSCGASVVVDSKYAPYARCHWCRSILSLDNKIENGSIPDVILTFCVNKKEASDIIEKYTKQRTNLAKKI